MVARQLIHVIIIPFIKFISKQKIVVEKRETKICFIYSAVKNYRLIYLNLVVYSFSASLDF
jgi:hypothetical protein